MYIYYIAFRIRYIFLEHFYKWIKVNLKPETINLDVCWKRYNFHDFCVVLTITVHIIELNV